MGLLFLLAAGGLGLAMLAAQQRIGVVALLLGRLRDHLGHAHPPPLLVDGHKDQEGTGHVQNLARLSVFRPHLHAHLHRGGKCAVDAGLERDQVAQVHRLDEVDVVHRGGHNVGARVPVGGHCASHINEVHQPSAQQIAQRVGVVGQDELGHF